jgi:hypothetical protein
MGEEKRSLEPMSDEALVAMKEEAYDFLRAGGSLSWREWESLEDGAKAAFLSAGEKLNIERAVIVGSASQGPLQAALILSHVDGGDLLCQVALDQIDARLGKMVNHEGTVYRP